MGQHVFLFCAFTFLEVVFCARQNINTQEIYPDEAGPSIRPNDISPFDIECVGPLPEWPLPIFGDWDPNLASLQEVCAAHEFGGHPRSVRAFCGQITLTGPGTVYPIFMDDDRRLSPFGGDLQNLRLFYYCQKRCFCRKQWDKQIVTERPPGYSKFDDITPSGERASHLLRIDEWPDFSAPLVNSLVPGGKKARTSWASRMTMCRLEDHKSRKSSALTDFERFILPHENKIKCVEGTPEPFVFPAPYDNFLSHDPEQNINTIQQLCAVGLSAGNPGANAGGYCHVPEDSPSWWQKLKGDYEEADVWFSDELTPRYEWTWDANWQFSTTIRYYCWQRCRCLHNPSPWRRPREGFWTLSNRGIVSSHRDGSSWLVKDQGGEDETEELISPGLLAFEISDRRGRSRSCKVNGVDYCKPRPWPLNSLGPKPSVFLSRTNLPLCGRACSGPASAQCDGGPNQGCECIAVPKLLKQRLGLATGKAVALCLIREVFNGLLAQTHDSGELKKRTVDSLGCPCNSTYVSKGCCGSEDGLIWEPENLRMGRLY